MEFKEIFYFIIACVFLAALLWGERSQRHTP
jgi:hypothetical protein